MKNEYMLDTFTLDLLFPKRITPEDIAALEAIKEWELEESKHQVKILNGELSKINERLNI